MAKAKGQVTKIYELKTLGYPELDKQLANVQKRFEAIRKAKHGVESKIVSSSDTAEVKKLSEELLKLQLKEQELRVETQKLTAEQKALNLQRAQEQEALRKQKSGIAAVAGSYAELYKRYRELYNLVKNTPKGSSVLFEGNTMGYDQAIAKLRELALAEQDFRRQFTRDATLVGEYTTGIVQAFKQMGLDDLVGGQITKIQNRVKDLNADFDRLQNELKETKAAGKETESIEKQMIENRNEVIKLDTEVARLRSDLRGTGDIGSQITSSMANGFKSIRGHVTSLVVQYASLSALFNQLQKGISNVQLAADQMTSLEIQLDGSAEAAANLNESLKGLDTRTSVLGLQQIADIALKAGVSAENIQEVTAAIDKTKIAFGSDFGSIEQGTDTLAKLISIFYDDGQITGQRILEVGNSLRTLANETTASVPFLTNFSGRMAGLRQIANITLPDILGLGAGFEQFKQSAEVSSTALTKIIPKLANDTEKYASVAGMTQEAFSALINTNPVEALLRISESLIKNSGSLDLVRSSLEKGGAEFENVVEILNKGGGGIEAISSALADSELGSGRITAVIATLGGHAELFRQRISRAGEAVQDTSAITDAYNRYNNNAAASIDKLNKKLTDFFATSKTFQVIVVSVTAFLSLLLTSLPALLTVVGLLTVSWAAQNATLLLLRGQVLLYNIAIGANIVLINALRIAQLGHNAVMLVFNGILSVVTRGLQLFGISAKAAAGPLGVIIATIGLIASALAGMNKAMAGTINLLGEKNRRMQAINEVNEAASKIYTQQIAVIDSWMAVIRSSATSADTKKKAMEELIKINGEFSKSVRDNIILQDELESAYNRVTAAIRAQATAQAAAQITAKKNKELADVIGLRHILEIENARQEKKPRTSISKGFLNIRKSDVTDDQWKILKDLPSRFSQHFVTSEALIMRGQVGPLLEKLKEIEAERQETFRTYLQVQQEAERDLETFLADQILKSGDYEVNIEKLKKQIEKLDEQINSFKGSEADLKKKVEERKKLQEELDRLLGNGKNANGKNAKSSGSRLTGDQKDALKDIDAERDKLLAEEELKRLQNKISEEDYLQNIYLINLGALNEKLKLLKGKNAEERRQIAQYNLEKVKLEQETNEKIYDLRAQALKDELDIIKKNAEEQNKLAQENDDLKPSEKAAIQLETDRIILKAQIDFNNKMDELEKKRNSVSKKNAEDRARELREIQERLRKDLQRSALAQAEDERKAGENLMNEFRRIMATQRQAILESDASDKKKRKALAALDEEERRGSLAREIAALKAELPKLKKALDEKAITEDAYLAKYEDYVNKMAELNKLMGATFREQLADARDISGLLTHELVNMFNFDLGTAKGRGQAELLAQTVKMTYDLAQTAMNDYYDAEAANIERSRDMNIKRLETERDQMLARAESMEEEESINQQFLARKEALEREAFEKNKKLQREQAKINLAIQLSNLAVIAFGPGPLNIATLGTAGAIMYAVQAALALANYAMNIKRINSATYEKGGVVAPTKTGGEIKGPSHKDGGVPFEYKEAEGKELMIINKRSAQDRRVRTLTGTNKQIASYINVLGGGVSFASGARETRFAEGGYLGQSLQPPILSPATSYGSYGGGAVNEKLDELIEVNRDLAERQAELAQQQSDRIDRLKVHVVAKDVSDAQSREQKQTQIGSII